jgi:excisionase family DNA binding protein
MTYIRSMDEDLPPFLTISDLATLLRVSPETIRRKARRGELPYVHGLNVWRFPRDAVMALLYSSEPPAGPR